MSPCDARPSLVGADAKPTQIRYGVLAFACSLSMITYLDRVCFGSAAPAIAAELDLPGVTALKWAVTAFAIAYAAFEIPAGWMGDRWGPRVTLIRIVAWWSVFTALTGLVGLRVGSVVLGGLGTLVILRFVFGMGEAGAYPNITRALHNWFPQAQWPTVQGWVWTCGRLAGGLTPLVWAVLVGASSTGPLSWREAFGLFGLLGFVWCVAFASWFRNRPEDHPAVNVAERALIGASAHTHAAHAAVPWRAFAASQTMWALCAMYFLLSYAWYFNITYLPSYMKDRFGVDDTGIVGPLLKGGPLWVGAIGCLLGGRLVEYVGRLVGDRARGRRLFCGICLAFGAPCWLAARQATTALEFFALCSAAAFVLDLTLGACWATCQDIGGRHAGVTAACMNTIGCCGSAVAGWVTGAVVEAALATKAAALDVAVTHLPAPDKLAALQAGYEPVFLGYAAAFAIAAVCWLFIDPSRSLVNEEVLLAGASGVRRAKA